MLVVPLDDAPRPRAITIRRYASPRDADRHDLQFWMQPMNPDFVDLLRAFVAAEVRFLVVGAYALAVHGPSRLPSVAQSSIVNPSA